VISQEPAGAATVAPQRPLAELLRGALAPLTCAALLLGLLSAWVATGGAGTIKHVSIEVTSASIAAPASPGGPGVGYLSVVNLGAADRLTSVTTPDAQQVKFVEHDSGAAGRPSILPFIALPARATVNLSPFGADIVLIGPKTLTPGQTIPLTFTFSAAGKVTVQAAITPPGTP
jgi:copper(I)-binding protein